MVTASVCGIRATLNVPTGRSTAATVRLIPSTAMEPFSAIRWRRPAGRSMTTSDPVEPFSTFLIRAVASTWPCTKWPSTEAFPVNGNSRLTGLPSANRPRLVLRRVSGTTSAKNAAPRFSTTVRQQPLTATLPPISSRLVVGPCWTPSRPDPASTTLPTPLTIPVNTHIPADHKIIAEPSEVHVAQPDGIFNALDSLATYRADCLATADHHGGDVREHLIDEAVGKESRVQLTAAFHQDTQQVPLAKLVQKGRQRYTTIGRRRQAKNLGCANPPCLCGCDERVGANNSRRLPDAELGIDYHAKGLPGVHSVQSRRQLRVVGDNGVDADQHCVVLVTQAMAVRACLVAGDPSRLTGAGGDLPVQAHRELGGHKWATRETVFDVKLV